MVSPSWTNFDRTIMIPQNAETMLSLPLENELQIKHKHRIGL